MGKWARTEAYSDWARQAEAYLLAAAEVARDDGARHLGRGNPPKLVNRLAGARTDRAGRALARDEAFWTTVKQRVFEVTRLVVEGRKVP